MSRFVSLVITTDGDIVFGNFRTHGGAAVAHGVAPGEYREADWFHTGLTDHLTVRCERGDDREHWLAMIRSVHPRWEDLFASLEVGRTVRYDVPPNFEATIENYQVSRDRLRDGVLMVFGDLGTSYSVDGLGRLHDPEGPALSYFGYEEWWLHGRRHRVGGPALVCPDGREEWFVDGKVVHDGGGSCVSPTYCSA